MGAHQQIPPFLYRIHPKFQTPYISIMFFGAIAVLLVLPGDVTQLADVYIVGAMLTFTLAHLAVVGMRIKEPDLERPFKLPFNVRMWNREIPITPLIGGSATFIVFIMVVVSRDFGRNVGIVWIVAGLSLYWWYRRVAGLSLTKTAPRLRTMHH